VFVLAEQNAMVERICLKRIPSHVSPDHFSCSTITAVYPNGTKSWAFDLIGGWPGTVLAISNDGTIFAGSGRFLLFLHLNETLAWEFETDYVVLVDIVVGKKGTVYFTTVSPGALRALCTLRIPTAQGDGSSLLAEGVCSHPEETPSDSYRTITNAVFRGFRT